MTDLQTQVRRQSLKWIVGNRMWCDLCKAALDCSHAVELDHYLDGALASTHVWCADCYDNKKAQYGDSWSVAIQPYEVLDGRELFPPAPPKSKAPQTRNAFHSADVKIGGFYKAKIGRYLCTVEITGTYRPPQYSFDTKRRPIRFTARNCRTGKQVKLTAAKLRSLAVNPAHFNPA